MQGIFLLSLCHYNLQYYRYSMSDLHISTTLGLVELFFFLYQ